MLETKGVLPSYFKKNYPMEFSVPSKEKIILKLKSILLYHSQIEHMEYLKGRMYAFVDCKGIVNLTDEKEIKIMLN